MTSVLAQLALELHNNYRRDHNAMPLKLDLNLNRQAESYAQEIAGGAKLSTRDEAGLGRNSYKIQTCRSIDDTQAIKEAVTSWYNYFDEHNWRNPIKSNALAQQFCNMVWKSHRNMGLGFVRRDNQAEKVIGIVTLYSPSADVQSNQIYTENVSPQK